MQGSHMNGVTSSRYAVDEARFRMDLFDDRAATDKINESLRIFLKDGAELKSMLRAIMEQHAAK